MLRCRGATVGTVRHVKLSPDRQWATLDIVFRRGQEDLARAGALFWVVRPTVGAGVVRGLETVMSGAFVQLRPSDGPKTNYFLGAEEPPPVELPSKALEISLLAPDLGSLQEQSPISYRGIQIGELTTYQLAPDARAVILHAASAPNTPPWSASTPSSGTPAASTCTSAFFAASMSAPNPPRP